MDVDLVCNVLIMRKLRYSSKRSGRVKPDRSVDSDVGTTKRLKKILSLMDAMPPCSRCFDHWKRVRGEVVVWLEDTMLLIHGHAGHAETSRSSNNKQSGKPASEEF